MSASSTIAARCSALSAQIVQIIGDASNFAVRFRQSRRVIRRVNADLFAIKLCLDIARSDFSTSGVTYPRPLLYAVFDILDCCASAAEKFHRDVIRLSVTESCNRPLPTVTDDRLVADLEGLKCALDVALDVNVLFFDPDSKHTTCSHRQRCSIGDSYTKATKALLRSIHAERKHVAALMESRRPVLDASFEKLGNCVESLLEESSTDETTQSCNDFRSDSLNPTPNEGYRAGILASCELPSPISPTTGIGTWIRDVVSNLADPYTTSSDFLTLSDPRTVTGKKKRDETAPSRGTFYTESTTSGSRTQSSGKSRQKKGKSRLRIDLSPTVSKPSKSTHSKYYTTATVLSSDDASLIKLSITSDKVAIAKNKRRHLTKDQKVAIDWELQHIPPGTSAANVERILWEGANPNAEEEELGSMFIRAAFEQSTDVLRVLIEYGADPRRTSPGHYFSAVHAAVLGNQLGNVEFLSELGLPLDEPNRSRETPLHLAVRTAGAYPIAKFLLDQGVDVNCEADCGTPLHVCLAAENLDARERTLMVELLFAHGAEGKVSEEACVRREKGLSVLGLI